MKKIIILLLLFVVTPYVFAEDQISVSFSKNSSGELIMNIKGHTAPITIQAGNNKITLQVIENVVNLTALGINDLTEVSVESSSSDETAKEENIEDVETAAGSNSSPDTQSPIPPINPLINPNPPLSTPF